jgi:hypothetical protein
MFRPLLAIFRRNTQLFLGSYLTTTDLLFCLIGLILCMVCQKKLQEIFLQLSVAQVSIFLLQENEESFKTLKLFITDDV